MPTETTNSFSATFVPAGNGAKPDKPVKKGI